MFHCFTLLIFSLPLPLADCGCGGNPVPFPEADPAASSATLNGVWGVAI